MMDEMSIINLRMRSGPQDEPFECSSDDVAERLTAMISQEASYQCTDYFSRSEASCRYADGNYDSDSHVLVNEEMLDAVCREKMCEWSYRVCDHFRTSREIVAIAFSFLDRFVDKCCCDRTAFKLAAMTSLYMATKIFNAKQLSISSLAELSRGEFCMAHIAEMERIILQTLQWKLNPPTTQSFINELCTFLPKRCTKINRTIHRRAQFFAELAVYDSLFVPHDKFLLAMGCILNAIEGTDDIVLTMEIRQEFLNEMLSSVCVQLDMTKLDHAQGRLWFLYSCSAQLRDDDDVMPLHVPKERLPMYSYGKGLSPEMAHSPVSVAGTSRQF